MPHKSDRSGVPGGSIIACDGTFPMRMVIRCLAKTTDQLWHKGSNQSLFRPQDLHITHFCIYAVGPQFVHKHLLSKYHRSQDLSRMPNGSQMCVFERPELSLITSRMIAASVADSPEENDTHPLFGRIVVIKKQCLEPLDLEFYEHKGLLQRWAEGIRPSIRSGTVHTKKSILVEYLTDPESARQVPATGAMVSECTY